MEEALDIRDFLTISEDDNRLMYSIENNIPKMEWVMKRMEQLNCNTIEKQVQFLIEREEDLTEEDYKDLFIEFLIGDYAFIEKNFFVIEVFGVLSRLMEQLKLK